MPLAVILCKMNPLLHKYVLNHCLILDLKKLNEAWLDFSLLGKAALVQFHQLTWLLCAKISVPALMKSAASKHGSNSVVTKSPFAANLYRSSSLSTG